MKVIRDGYLHGKTIELEEDTGLPDGVYLRIILESPDISLDEQKERLKSLCGAWSDDPSLEDIFDEIQQEREKTLPRDINL